MGEVGSGKWEVGSGLTDLRKAGPTLLYYDK